MELKKEFLGSRVFIKRLGREVLICDENKLTLINYGFTHFFEIKKQHDKVIFIDDSNDKRRIKTRKRKS